MAKIRHEINILNGTLVATSPTPASSSEIFIVPVFNYSGTFNAYLEIYISSGTGTVEVVDNVGGSYVSSGAQTGPIVSRSAAINWGSYSPATPLQIKATASSGTLTVKAARIVILQDTGSATTVDCSTHIEIGSRSSVTSTAFPTGTGASNMTSPKYWKYDSALWDGSVIWSFAVTLTGSSTKTVSQVQLQVADGTGNGFTGWTNVSGGLIGSTSLAPFMGTGSAFTPISGRWYRIVALSATSKTAMNVWSAKIVANQTGATKLQPQYLFSNTLLAAGTALQTFLEKWDSTEWSGVSNTYTFQVEAAASSTSAVQLRTADNATLVATVTSPNNAGTGAATMPP